MVPTYRWGFTIVFFGKGFVMSTMSKKYRCRGHVVRSFFPVFHPNETRYNYYKASHDKRLAKRGKLDDAPTKKNWVTTPIGNTPPLFPPNNSDYSHYNRPASRDYLPRDVDNRVLEGNVWTPEEGEVILDIPRGDNPAWRQMFTRHAPSGTDVLTDCVERGETVWVKGLWYNPKEGWENVRYTLDRVAVSQNQIMIEKPIIEGYTPLRPGINGQRGPRKGGGRHRPMKLWRGGTRTAPALLISDMYDTNGQNGKSLFQNFTRLENGDELATVFCPECGTELTRAKGRPKKDGSINYICGDCGRKHLAGVMAARKGINV